MAELTRLSPLAKRNLANLLGERVWALEWLAGESEPFGIVRRCQRYDLVPTEVRTAWDDLMCWPVV